MIKSISRLWRRFSEWRYWRKRGMFIDGKHYRVMSGDILKALNQTPQKYIFPERDAGY